MNSYGCRTLAFEMPDSGCRNPDVEECSMKPLLAVGMAAVGGVIVFRCLPRERRDRLAAALGHRVTEHLGHLMDSLSLLLAMPDSVLATHELPGKKAIQRPQLQIRLASLEGESLPVRVNAERQDHGPAQACGFDGSACGQDSEQ